MLFLKSNIQTGPGTGTGFALISAIRIYFVFFFVFFFFFFSWGVCVSRGRPFACRKEAPFFREVSSNKN